MDTKEESLQKLTEYEIAAKELMAQDAITFNDVKTKFKGADRTTFTNFLCGTYNQLKGVAQDEFYLKCEDIFSIVIDKNRRWERNHNQITWAISTLMQEIN